jgi:hypothetical protein
MDNVNMLNYIQIMGIHTDTVKDESFLTLFIAGPEKGKN